MTTTPTTSESSVSYNVTDTGLTAFNTQIQRDHIAELAYYKAENRGFVPGHELDDWLEAESEILKAAA